MEQVEDLKAAAIRGTVAEHDVRELKEENRQLRSRLPSVKEQLKEAEEQQRLLNENYDLRVEVEYLTESLNSERDFSSRLLEGIGAVLDFLDRHLPEQFRPLVEKARVTPRTGAAAAGTGAGTRPHLGRHGAVKKACPGT